MLILITLDNKNAATSFKCMYRKLTNSMARKSKKQTRESLLPYKVQPRCCQEIPENQKGRDGGKT